MNEARPPRGYGSECADLSGLSGDRDALRTRLLERFRAPEYEPPVLPKAAAELMELSRRMDVSFVDVERVLEQDPLLTGEVLRTAASPMYLGRVPVRSLTQAVQRLGLRTLRDIAVQVSLQRKIFKAKGAEALMRALGRHSAATAHGARIVTRYCALESEHAFLCGLLHDVGVAGAVIVLAESGGPLDLENQWSAILDVHEEGTVEMLRRWALPTEALLPLGVHHAAMIGGHVHPMAAAIRLADELAEAMGFGIEQLFVDVRVRTPSNALRPAQVIEALGLSNQQLVLIERDLTTALESLE